MKPTQDKAVFHPALFRSLPTILPSYRLQMPAAEVMTFSKGNACYICPGYRIIVEREFMSF